MENLSISIYIISIVFLIVAFAYSSVGLGGGSSYTAILALTGISFVAIPTISLCLNLIVTTVGSFNFLKKKHGRLRLILPFFITSIPMSYLGGSLKLDKEVFYWILLITLIFVIIKIYIWKNTSERHDLGNWQRISISLIFGSVLGFVSGIVGIGGGIYLVPLIIIFGLGSEKEAAACGVLFIWVNSLSGLAARFQYNPVNINEFIPIIIAVLFGGLTGSYLGSSLFSAKAIQKILSIIIIFAIIALTKKILFI